MKNCLKFLVMGLAVFLYSKEGMAQGVKTKPLAKNAIAPNHLAQDTAIKKKPGSKAPNKHSPSSNNKPKPRIKVIEVECPYGPDPLLGEVSPRVNDGPASYEPLAIAEIMPQFMGNQDSLYAYLKRNINYPAKERKELVQGKVFISFVIDTTGKVVKPQIVKTCDRCENFEKEAIRVFSQMPPWEPGKNSGRKVEVKMTFPIAFKLK